jgi:hypothetical protein
MIFEPYRYLWREEITEGGHYPNHTYITKGTTLYGYVRKGTTDVIWFKTPKSTWSPTRRKFRKFNKKDIDQLMELNINEL